MVNSKRKIYHGLGRRKSAVSRAWLHAGGQGQITINDTLLDEFAQSEELKKQVLRPLTVTDQLNNFDVTVKAVGGGFRGQIDATRLAIAKALLKVDAEFRAQLKPEGLLTTDARVKERKKPGLKKARKSPQYTKR